MGAATNSAPFSVDFFVRRLCAICAPKLFLCAISDEKTQEISKPKVTYYSQKRLIMKKRKK